MYKGKKEKNEKRTYRIVAICNKVKKKREETRK